MKVLWMCGNDSAYTGAKQMSRDADGSWMESLLKIVREYHPDIQLSVAFMSKSKAEVNDTIDGIGFYSLKIPLYRKLMGNWRNPMHRRYRYILDRTKPDIIHVFGSETELGLIYSDTNIPIVLHIQGILNNYARHWWPTTTSNMKEWFYVLCHPFELPWWLVERKVGKLSQSNELDILSHIHYYMGRTEWDKALTDHYAPRSKYYYCPEALRPTFAALEEKWKWDGKRPLRIVSIMSAAIYKGLDTILQTASVLKNTYHADFEWNVVGIDALSTGERLAGIKGENVNVKAVGRMNSRLLIEALKNAAVYVHLAYIENSSNAVCEAQIAGIPVVATCVGGMQSLIKHGEDGILVPVSEPALTAHIIMKLYKRQDLATAIGQRGHDVAKKRHDPVGIGDCLSKIYYDVVQSESHANEG